jgi:hypothetical protein
MTFGSVNNENPIDMAPQVILNEVMFNPTAPEYGFVEVMYIGETAKNIDGYIVICDDVIQFVGTWILDTADPYAVVLESDTPNFFANMTPANDNVYLYDYNGTLLDMVGWSSAHTMNMTVTRVPDGFGTYQGYEDTTSIAAGWVFDQIATIPLVNVGPPDLFGYGDIGDEIWFNYTITNKQDIDDWFEILNQSMPNGWIVEIYEEDMVTKITGPIFIQNGSTYNISVRVIIPTTYPIGDYDNITITVRSLSNQGIAFNVYAQARVYAYLEPDKTISPDTINVWGTGYDEEATITLNVSGRGMGTPVYLSQDIVFLIDNSGSMTTSDPTGERFEAAKGYTYNLLENDTAATVTFYDGGAWVARLPLQPAEHLTSDFVQVRNTIDYTSGWVSGGTNILQALSEGRTELNNYGNNSHTWVMILLTDGVDSYSTHSQIWAVADQCANDGIIVFCIGLGPGADMVLLDGIAARTGGLSYPAPDPSYLEEIYQDIASMVSQIAGYDIDTADATPMIRDVLPPWIDYVPGSFSIPPDIVYVNATGYTILEWNVSSIAIGQTWSVTFNIVSTMNGYIEANNFTASRINYTDYNYRAIEKEFPKTMINVVIGEPGPPELYIEVINDDQITVDGRANNIRLSWIPPLTPNTDYYLIYKSNSQTGFDFSSPWVRTDMVADNWSLSVEKTRTTWNDTGSVSLGDESYYCIRAVNTGGEISDSSRTVGRWTTTFNAGVSTFSIPLGPLQTVTTDNLLTDMNANYTKWMNPTTHVWMKHGDGGVNSTTMEVGKGYEIKFDSQTKYTFTGMPGAMILYDNVSFGFNTAAGSNEADSLTAFVDSSGYVTVNWTQPANMIPGVHQFYIFRSTTRDGFWGGSGAYDHIATLPVTNPGGLASYQDTSIVVGAYTEYYYMIMPADITSGARGSGSYSIGIWTAGYLDQYDTIGLPLKLDSIDTVDWYCDRITSTVGINYFDEADQRWQWHATRMPENAFDTLIEMGLGYQISTSAPTKNSFVGR